MLREGIGKITPHLSAGISHGAPQEDSHEHMMNMLNREIRRRTRMVSSFPDGNSALIFFYARIRYVATNKRSARRYLDIS